MDEKPEVARGKETYSVSGKRAGTHTKTEVTTCILTTEVRARAAAWVAMGGAVTDDPPWTLTPC